ncbi:uncharacterized protein LOC118933794 [Manis pentadactyla]|uniref:uncharacterized protein LOC118933794 n=1 Tax=Manis pentadactyla TaxID=143292 RepID=UPI00255C5174|nr:uncharacterized protein LOC118933794 [Manis pentadactyla]
MSRVPGALGHRLGRGPRSESRWRGEKFRYYNLPPPTLATPKSDAVPGGSRIHWRTTSRLLKGGERDRGGATQVLPSRPPRIAVLPGPWLYRTRAGGAPAGGGYQVRARTTALIPRTADKPRAPRAAQAGSAQPGFRRSPGPRPPAANGSALEPGRQPLARLAWPRRTLKEKSPSTQRPASAPQESTGGGRKARGRRAPGSGSKLTGRCERRCRRWRTHSRSRRSRCRAGPAPTGRSAVRAPRLAPFSSCSARTGAGVTALRRRCSLALSPDRCSPARRPAACRRSLFLCPQTVKRNSALGARRSVGGEARKGAGITKDTCCWSPATML